MKVVGTRTVSTGERLWSIKIYIAKHIRRQSHRESAGTFQGPNVVCNYFNFNHYLFFISGASPAIIQCHFDRHLRGLCIVAGSYFFRLSPRELICPIILLMMPGRAGHIQVFYLMDFPHLPTRRNASTAAVYSSKCLAYCAMRQLQGNLGFVGCYN